MPFPNRLFNRGSWLGQRPPYIPTEPNLSHPISRDLAFWFSPHVDWGTWRDRVGKQIGTGVSGSPERVIDPVKGRVISLDGTSGQEIRFPNNNLPTDIYTDPVTVAVWVKPDFTTWGDTIISVGNGSDYASIRYMNGGTWSAVCFNGGWTKNLDHTFSYSAGQWYLAVYSTWGGASSEQMIWVNGIPSDQSGNGILTAGSALTAVEYGDRYGGSNDTTRGDLGDAYVWNRVLSDAEVLQIYREPWVLHTPKQSQFYWEVPAVAPAQQAVSFPNLLFNRGGWVGQEIPNTPVVLNKNSPQARGLVGAWLPSGAKLTDLAGRNSIGAFRGDQGVEFRQTDRGMSLYTGTNETETTLTDLGDYHVAQDITAIVRVKQNARDITNHVVAFGKWNTGAQEGTNEWMLGLNYRNNQNDFYPYFMVDIDSTKYVAGFSLSYQWALGDYIFLAGVRKGAYMNMWKSYNGEPLVEAVTADTPTTGNINSVSARRIRLGQMSAGGQYNNHQADYYEARLYDRALSYNEIEEALYNPWELYQPMRPQFYWSVPAEAPVADERISRDLFPVRLPVPLPLIDL